MAVLGSVLLRVSEAALWGVMVMRVLLLGVILPRNSAVGVGVRGGAMGRGPKGWSC